MDINTHYVPMDAKEACKTLNALPGKPWPVRGEYSNMILQPAAIIDYKGHEPRKAFQGFGLYLVDYGKVGRVFTDVAIRKCYGYMGKGQPLPSGPRRFGVESGVIFPLTCKEFETWLGVLKDKDNLRKENEK